MLCFEVVSKFDNGYEVPVFYERDTCTLKELYKRALSDARYDAWKHNAIVDVNVFEKGNYKETVQCVFSCGLFGPIHWNVKLS